MTIEKKRGIMDWAKIASLAISTFVIVFNMGRYSDKIENSLHQVSDHESRIKVLEQWKEKVTAYYLPKSKQL